MQKCNCQIHGKSSNIPLRLGRQGRQERFQKECNHRNPIDCLKLCPKITTVIWGKTRNDLTV